MRPSFRLTALTLAFFSAPAILAVHPSWSQDFPSRPIIWVVPSAPGGVSDLGARVIAKPLSARLHQPVIVDARPGAGGIIAAETVARAKPDGHTMLYATSGIIAANPWIYKKLPYDPLRGFAPVASMGTAPMLLLINAASPWKSAADFIAFARLHPDKVNVGSSGVGTGQHMGLELFRAATQAQVMHVAYKAASPAINDLVAGSIDAVFDFYGAAQSLVDSGKLRALASTGTARLRVLPDVPTFTELGYPDIIYGAWGSAVVPAGTPAAVVDLLAETFDAAMKEPEVVAYQKTVGVSPFDPPLRKEALLSFHKAEQARIGKLVEAAAITAP
jgi:tripartite-type tricarboxylate transporter receptor subunit TctC